MPRPPGARIESPATLGRKCWAFAYLAQIWPPLRGSLVARTKEAGLDLSAFVKAFDLAIPSTMQLCPQVMANCFVNGCDVLLVCIWMDDTFCFFCFWRFLLVVLFLSQLRMTLP